MVHAVEALAADHELTIIGPTGGELHCPANVRYLGCPPSPALFLPCALTKVFLEARRRNWRLILGGSGVVAPVTRLIARLFKLPAGVLVHGLDLVAKSRVYQQVFVPAIRGHDIIIANSENTRRLAIERGCAEERLRIVNPGCRIPTAAEAPDTGAFRRSHDLEDARIVLFVGRIIKRKGLIPFITRAWSDIAAGVEHSRLVIVGDSPADAVMRNASEARELNDAVDRTPPDSIRFLGKVDDSALAACYASADCLVFPLIPVNGDVEGFGMVATEAAAWGTPTIAFRVGGVADAVSDELSGRLIPPGDYETFTTAVVEACLESPYDRDDIRNFASVYSWERYSQQLREALGVDAR